MTKQEVEKVISEVMPQPILPNDKREGFLVAEGLLKKALQDGKLCVPLSKSQDCDCICDCYIQKDGKYIMGCACHARQFKGEE